jgi:hypothetical protein
MVLMQEEIARLQDAIEASTKRKNRKRRYVQAEETLTVGEVADLIATKEGRSYKEGETPAKRVHSSFMNHVIGHECIMYRRRES